MTSAKKRIPVVREVVVFGTPVLREKAKKVARIDESIIALVEDMLITMRARNGIGLAAQQVGETVAVCVIDTASRNSEDEAPECTDVPMPLVMINPEITESTGTESCEEGCLSLPEIFVSVSRAAEVTAAYQDLSGKRQTIRAKGLLSRAVQHELDHLQGILLVDRMSAIKKISLSGKLKKLKKEAAERIADLSST